MTKNQIIRSLKANLKQMGKTRDELRDLLDEVEDNFDRCSEAYSSLDECIDRLSEVI